MLKTMQKNILSLFVLIFFGILACGSLETDAKTKEVQSQEAVYTLSARSLYAEYKQNEVAADAKYKDKVVIVSGRITNIGKDFADTAYVILAGDEYFGVQCMFAKGEEGVVAQLSKGETVTIKGVVSRLVIGSLLLNSCRQLFDNERSVNAQMSQSAPADEPNFISVNGRVIPNPKKQLV